MKTNMKILFVLLSLGLFFQSCGKDNFEEVILSRNEMEEPVIETVASGTLTLDVFLKDAITITTARALTLEEALDIMVVEITSTDGLTTFVSDNYRNLPASIELPAGMYNMLISNFPLSDVRFDDGVYGDYIRNFEVTSGNNTLLNPVLRLLDVATTVNFSSDIITAYPDISVYVSRSSVDAGVFGEFPTPLIYEIADNGRRGYHSLFSGNHLNGFEIHSGEFWVQVSATDNAGDTVSVTKTIGGMVSNTHFNINIDITAPASTSLDVTLEPEADNTENISFPN